MEEDIRKYKNLWLLLSFLVVLQTIGITCSMDIPEPKKRQIYREGVLPSRGGVIPEGAFTRQRLKHNIHDSLGVEAPDGYLYLARETDIRPGRLDPEDERDILTLTHTGPRGYVDINGLVPPKPQASTIIK
ncbi:hypothetical protein SK128_026338 [Halocaridina rubra]|uniref:Glucose/Sorbosone dehydrogenase domain-containing protein n=1 Tax=Halocaridina rubra TaxID=373956 RepID=A0AAN8XE34_HALRR